MLGHICLDFAGVSLDIFGTLQVTQRDARIAALEDICRHRDSSATPAKQVHLSPPESAPTAWLLQAAAVHTRCVAGLHICTSHNANSTHNADITPCRRI